MTSFFRFLLLFCVTLSPVTHLLSDGRIIDMQDDEDEEDEDSDVIILNEDVDEDDNDQEPHN